MRRALRGAKGVRGAPRSAYVRLGARRDKVYHLLSSILDFSSCRSVNMQISEPWSLSTYCKRAQAQWPLTSTSPFGVSPALRERYEIETRESCPAFDFRPASSLSPSKDCGPNQRRELKDSKNGERGCSRKEKRRRNEQRTKARYLHPAPLLLSFTQSPAASLILHTKPSRPPSDPTFPFPFSFLHPHPLPNPARSDAKL